MKRCNFFLVLPLLLLMIACGENKTENPKVAEVTEQKFQDPEEAMTNWQDAWRSNDPSQIRPLIADDAVLLLNGEEVPQAHIKDFIQGSGPVLLDLQLKSRKKGSAETVAYDTGIFTHKNANKPGEFTGSYTFIWERNGNEENWKVKAINISNVHPALQMPEMQQTN